MPANRAELELSIERILAKSSNKSLNDPMLISILAFEACKAFPEEDWSKKAALDNLEEFVAIGLRDFLYSKSFNSAKEFLRICHDFNSLVAQRGKESNWESADKLESIIRAFIKRDQAHPLAIECRRKMLPYVRNQSLRILLVVGLSLGISAALAGSAAAFFAIAGSKMASKPHDYDDLVGTICTVVLFSLTTRITLKAFKSLRSPCVNPVYEPLTVVIAFIGLILFHLTHGYFIFENFGLSPNLRMLFGFMLTSAKKQWLFAAPFVVIMIYLRESLRFGHCAIQMESRSLSPVRLLPSHRCGS